MHAVLDVNVIVSALLSSGGTPALLIRAWRGGSFDLLISLLLLSELRRALSYPKLQARIALASSEEFLDGLNRFATVLADPASPPRVRSADPHDDYLIALAEAGNAFLVSGDNHLLSLAPRLPIRTPAEFLALLDARG
ncbi:MAG: putative toxin-antitoxin system toxin component, PIN family [Candidatus Limnocylindrales bacterium]